MPEIASYWQANCSRRPLGGVEFAGSRIIAFRRAKRLQRGRCRSYVVFWGF